MGYFGLESALIHGNLMHFHHPVYSISFDKQHTHFEGKAPKVQIVGQYEMSGHILLQHINGKGDISLSLGK
jgi:hypothetical protein